MNYKIVIRSRAEEHLKEAYDWYESKRIGLGEEFLLIFESMIMLIERNPLSFQLKHKQVRCGLMPRFPFGIFYFTDEDKIMVIAVLHLSRDPKNWKS